MVTGVGGCSSASNVVTVTRLATPNANILIVNPDNNPDLCVNDKVKLRGNGASGIPLGYQWHYNGAEIDGATGRDYVALEEGSYRLTVTNLNTGCSKLSVPVAVINSCREEGVQDQQSPLFSMYPNPTDGNFVLLLNLYDESEGMATLQVYNSLGQVVINENVPVTEGRLMKEINLQEGAARGMYFVNVKFNGQAYNGQIVYQH